MSYTTTYLFSNINTMCFFLLLLVVGDQRRSRNDGNDEDETNATQRNSLFSIYIISGFYL